MNTYSLFMLLLSAFIATPALAMTKTSVISPTYTCPLFEFRDALAKKDSSRALSLIGPGLNPNGRDLQGDPLVHSAATAGMLPVVTALIQGGADANAKNKKGLTLLLHALKENSLELFSTLLELDGINHSITDAQRNGPTHYAVRYSDPSLLGQLLTNYTYISPIARTFFLNQLNKQGDSPLHLALKRGKQEHMRLLMQDETVDQWLADTKGHAPLDIAFNLSYGPCTCRRKIKSTFHAPLNPVLQTMFRYLYLKKFSKLKTYIQKHSTKVDLNTPNHQDLTLLGCASGAGAHEIVDALLRAKADPNKLSDTHLPLQEALLGRHPLVIQLLCAAGADVNKPIVSKPLPPLNQIYTASLLIQAAAHDDNVGFVTLLGCGADVDQKDSEGYTILYHLIGKPSDQLLKATLKHWPDLTVKNTKGRTAFDRAIALEDTVFVKAYLLHILPDGLEKQMLENGQARISFTNFNEVMLSWQEAGSDTTYEKRMYKVPCDCANCLLHCS